MKSSFIRPCFSRRTRLAALWLSIGLPLYIFSTGPVGWATNDAFHPRYLPDEVNFIYMPLAPLLKIECINWFFYWWTAIVWRGRAVKYPSKNGKGRKDSGARAGAGEKRRRGVIARSERIELARSAA